MNYLINLGKENSERVYFKSESSDIRLNFHSKELNSENFNEFIYHDKNIYMVIPELDEESKNKFINLYMITRTKKLINPIMVYQNREQELRENVIYQLTSKGEFNLRTPINSAIYEDYTEEIDEHIEIKLLNGEKLNIPILTQECYKGQFKSRVLCYSKVMNYDKSVNYQLITCELKLNEEKELYFKAIQLTNFRIPPITLPIYWCSKPMNRYEFLGNICPNQEGILKLTEHGDVEFDLKLDLHVLDSYTSDMILKISEQFMTKEIHNWFSSLSLTHQYQLMKILCKGGEVMYDLEKDFKNNGKGFSYEEITRPLEIHEPHGFRPKELETEFNLKQIRSKPEILKPIQTKPTKSKPEVLKPIQLESIVIKEEELYSESLKEPGILRPINSEPIETKDHRKQELVFININHRIPNYKSIEVLRPINSEQNYNQSYQNQNYNSNHSYQNHNRRKSRQSREMNYDIEIQVGRKNKRGK